MSLLDDGLKMRMSVRNAPTLPPMLRKTSFANAQVVKARAHTKMTARKRMKTSPSEAEHRPQVTISSVTWITLSRNVSPTRWIRAQHSHHFRELAKTVEGASDVRIVGLSDEVEIEGVLPRL